MPPDPPRGYRLWRAFIRTPLRQILDPPQVSVAGVVYVVGVVCVVSVVGVVYVVAVVCVVCVIGVVSVVAVVAVAGVVSVV